MTVKWNTPAGSLGVITERITIDIPLNAESDSGDITLSLLAGNLPRGLKLVGNSVKGSPTEVRKFTESKFVIRASDGTDIEDRTFVLSVDGSDLPSWITPEEYLRVGSNDNYFVLDNSYVSFQLEAYDSDVIVGDQLEYYLVPNGGELPPGLSVSRSGLISGFTDPIFSVEYQSNETGSFDTAGYDILPLDKPAPTSNGFDSFLYDTVTFDYNDTAQTPRRLSRLYSFIVAVSDGVNEVRRLFRIWVVTDEFLKSDNTFVQVDTNLFRSDNTSNRIPIWITESYLGRFRANNYITIFLDVYDPPSLSGTITYLQQGTNPGSYRLLETEEIVSGFLEITGTSPQFKYNDRGIYKPEVTYNVGDAIVYTDFLTYNSRGDWDPDVTYNVGDYVIYELYPYRALLSGINKIPVDHPIHWRRMTADIYVCQKTATDILPTDTTYWSTSINRLQGTFTPLYSTLYEVLEEETVSQLPPGMVLDAITGNIAGRVPYQAAITKNYKFTIRAIDFPTALGGNELISRGSWNTTTAYQENDTVIYEDLTYIARQASLNQLPGDEEYWTVANAISDKTFNVDIIGEIESNIVWLSDEFVGEIKPNQPSRLFVEAETLNYGGRVLYDLVSGTLPPGLQLLGDGYIQGKVKQFSDSAGPGLIRFYERDSAIDDSTGSYDFVSTTFDDGATTFDRVFSFQIKARDSANFSEAIKDFSITVVADNTKTFANLYLKAFQNKEKRLEWINFITDSNIFRPDEIYRYGDPNYGVQNEIRMLLFAGIESVEAVNYVQAMSRNHYRKRIRFGDVKYAQAKDPDTQEIIYEVVYAEIVDNYEKNGKSISSTIELSDTINSKVLVSYDAIKVDSNIPFVSDSDHQRIFPNSIKNMRRRIKSIGERDREFLPLWMRSIQSDSFVETGFVKALPLCYTKSGFSEKIISRIKSSGFDFKTIDFEADRYLIDIIDGEIEDKYLAFPQRGEKLP